MLPVQKAAFLLNLDLMNFIRYSDTTRADLPHLHGTRLPSSAWCGTSLINMVGELWLTETISIAPVRIR
jgi:hypothetical protein